MDITKNRIGENAGVLWRLMSQDFQRKWTLDELKRRTGMDDYELASAVGWLAREDNIDFENRISTDEENQLYVYLSVNVYY